MISASKRSIPVIIVAGLSGAGKSSALKVFEDMAYYTIDGLPVSMTSQFIEVLTGCALESYKGIVLGVDVRQSTFRDEWAATIQQLATAGYSPTVIFLESRADVILRRYKETRRPHPFEGCGTGLEQAMTRERELMAPARAEADFIFDTSEYSIHDLRRVLQRRWQSEESDAKGLKVHIMSFGFKHSTPSEADMIFDLRFLPNPYHNPELRPFSGQDEPVVNFVLNHSMGQTYLKKLEDLLHFTLLQMEKEGRYRITIGFGCTGGKHRSVAVTEAIYNFLKKSDFAVSKEHRHINLA
ncbi:RNase adapter RapZ [Halodesulfovibrio spirochaetisodalis]|uniref:Nucleotide-binding protein n=1 Tax=Halodesulfovibrio spirochaetisodalis TaxID=1560234 RepID=A0A1B7XBJ6_9BACT|nr:RNase adapter RapZ [Halodesulfovibrio spirochaetisodalis]OBQ50135.1 nucleotide-binding protein [Halodesulfovibrio spirochaetisodalis]